MFAEDFAGQILSFDGVAAEAFAAIAASRRRMGSPIQPLDGQIAAIAVAQGASIATRDVTDFQRCGVELINPWGQSAVPLDGNV